MKKQLRLSKAQQDWIRSWWQALQPEEDKYLPKREELCRLNRGDRARLRRCANLDELLQEAASHLLARRLIALSGEKDWPWTDPDLYGYWALIAGVLANVKDDTQKGETLALCLGHAKSKEKGRPLMNELRFKSLQRSKTPDDLYLQWQRAVQVADGKLADVPLADDLLDWLVELKYPVRQASHSVKFRSASDYYDVSQADDKELPA